LFLFLIQYFVDFSALFMLWELDALLNLDGFGVFIIYLILLNTLLIKTQLVSLSCSCSQFVAIIIVYHDLASPFM